MLKQTLTGMLTLMHIPETKKPHKLSRDNEKKSNRYFFFIYYYVSYYSITQEKPR
jgi:hypothetical protein